MGPGILTVAVRGLARVGEFALDNIVSWVQLENNTVALGSADGLGRKGEPTFSNLDGVHGGRSEWQDSREEDAVHLGG